MLMNNHSPAEVQRCGRIIKAAVTRIMCPFVWAELSGVEAIKFVLTKAGVSI